MSTRRPTRPSHVRPRTPSSGRPGPERTRPRPKAGGRIPATRPAPTRRGLPLVTRILLAAAVVSLVAVVLMAGVGGLGGVIGAMGSAFGGLVDRVTATPVPSATPTIALDAPSLAAPVDPYTNRPTVTLSGTIARRFAGDPDYTLRIDVTLPAGQPTEVKEVAVPATAAFSVPGIGLVEGQNDFTATLVGPDGESEPSAIVTYVLDAAPPEVKVTSPADGATINREAVEVEGRTQPGSDLVARNEANGATATATADEDGAFLLSVPIADGPNGITVTATDPAGNPGSTVLTVRRGTGKLTADLTASTYRIAVGSLPEPLTVRVVVTDPDGVPLEGAEVLFTITVPGIPPIVPSAMTTGGDGSASFRTTIPTAATPGTGPITARVTTLEFGELTERTVLTIAP